MKRKIILSIFMIITILIANISFAAGTPTAELTATADKTTITSTDKTVEVTIKLGNMSNLVTTGSNVVLAYEGTLEYDANMFESVTVKGQNDWTATYEPTTKKIIGDTTTAKANTVIAKLTFTLKDSIAKDSTGNIKLNNVVLTDETNDFNFNTIIAVTNKTEESKEDKNQVDNNVVIDDNNVVDNGTGNVIDKVASKNNNVADSSQAKGSLPKAGFKNIIVIAVLVIVITGVFSFARYKMIKLK